MIIVGIDPGLEGAIAVIENGQLIRVEDMPLIGKLVDHRAVTSLCALHRPAHIAIEEIGVRRGQSRPQDIGLSFRNFGRLETAIHVWPHTIITPQQWTKAVGRPKGKDYADNKEQSRLLAIQLFPDMYDRLKRKGDNGRAEAALIALAQWTVMDRRSAA